MSIWTEDNCWGEDTNRLPYGFTPLNWDECWEDTDVWEDEEFVYFED